MMPVGDMSDGDNKNDYICGSSSTFQERYNLHMSVLLNLKVCVHKL